MAELNEEILGILEENGFGEDPPAELTAYLEKNAGSPWFISGVGFNDLAKSLARKRDATGLGLEGPPEPEAELSPAEQIKANHEAAYAKDLASLAATEALGHTLGEEWANRVDALAVEFGKTKTRSIVRQRRYAEEVAAFTEEFGQEPDLLGYVRPASTLAAREVVEVPSNEPSE